MTYQWATASHQGRVRATNEDAVFPATSGRGAGPVLIVVADGMGGHVAGEVASQLAVDNAVASEGSVTERVHAANRAILAEIERLPELAGMGTTITLMELGDDRTAQLGHVGDSRAYLLRGETLALLTDDHTVVGEYVRTGRLRPDEASTHPQRSMLTRALGLAADLEIDTDRLELEPGDRILLCSDGVNSMLGDAEIKVALAAGTPEEAAWELVERANRAGGQDNITAVVVDLEE